MALRPPAEGFLRVSNARKWCEQLSFGGVVMGSDPEGVALDPEA